MKREDRIRQEIDAVRNEGLSPEGADRARRAYELYYSDLDGISEFYGEGHSDDMELAAGQSEEELYKELNSIYPNEQDYGAWMSGTELLKFNLEREGMPGRIIESACRLREKYEQDAWKLLDGYRYGRDDGFDGKWDRLKAGYERSLDALCRDIRRDNEKIGREGRKYELTDEMRKVNGIPAYRIRALRDFGDVKAGELGGFVQGEHNLSHNGNSWIRGDAAVLYHARVRGDATVRDEAIVLGGAVISGRAEVCHSARVQGQAYVCGDAGVYERAVVRGHATVRDGALVHGPALVEGSAVIRGQAIIENAKISGRADIGGDAAISYHASITGDAKICSNGEFYHVEINTHWSQEDVTFFRGEGDDGRAEIKVLRKDLATGDEELTDIDGYIKYARENTESFELAMRLDMAECAREQIMEAERSREAARDEGRTGAVGPGCPGYIEPEAEAGHDWLDGFLTYDGTGSNRGREIEQDDRLSGFLVADAGSGERQNDTPGRDDYGHGDRL